MNPEMHGYGRNPHSTINNCEHNYVGGMGGGTGTSATDYWRKRSFSQAFVPSAGEMPPRYSVGFNHDAGRGPRSSIGVPFPGAFGVHEGASSNSDTGINTVYAGRNSGHINHQQDPAHRQYFHGMLPPPFGNGGISGFVPFTKMPPPSLPDYRGDFAVIHPWPQQQDQHHNNKLRTDGHTLPPPQQTLMSNASINCTVPASNTKQRMNSSMDHSDIFARSLNQVLGSPPPVFQSLSQELPPPDILLPRSSSSGPHVSLQVSSNPAANLNFIGKQSSTSSMTKVNPKPQELMKPTTATTASKILIGKRRGGKILPTGVIKRVDGQSVGNRKITSKTTKDGPVSPSTAWSRYMAEVERYRNQSCSDETPNRSLVK